MSEAVTKRLHISGLTAQISEKDLKERFSSFGTVRALDGYGKRDGNGDFRPYAYLTLESTKGQLAKCLNLLSGATWKGAKLRIGEAKPDFRERIVKENESMKRASDEDSSRPKKRRRLLRGCQGFHSADMSLVTPENFSKRSVWRKTPLGRLIRPIRMRPLRPLPPPTDLTKPAKGVKGSLKQKKLKKTRTGLLTRARRKLIDPTRWGSEYIKGVLLENSISASYVRPLNDVESIPDGEDSSTVDSESESPDDDDSTDKEASVQPESTPEDESTDAPSIPVRPLSTATSRPEPAQLPRAAELESELAREAAKDLALLASIFGDANSPTNDWGGEESLSDIDIDQAQMRTVNVGEGDVGDIEMVPRDPKLSQKQAEAAENTAKVDRDGTGEETPITVSKEPAASASAASPTTQNLKVQITKLKDMFAPREEDAVGFSLLGNLDIDLELDETINIAPISAPSYPSQTSVHPATPVSPVPNHAQSYSHTPFTLDASAPLFFPILDPDQRRSRVKFKDILSIAHEKGWDTAFCRTESEDEIKQRWEKAKTELTVEWKRRHREGVKSARRRGGGGQD